MSETPGEHLDPEPQSERGPKGSRDIGSDEPSGGPVDRPADGPDDDAVTSADQTGSDQTGSDQADA